jgi:5-methylcytosine-specific restriction enzyme A
MEGNQMKQVNGRSLNSEWKVGAAHALYRKFGDWYHVLRRFPGALFDAQGYIKFETREEYDRCSNLRIRYASNTTHVEKPGIQAIPGYVRVSA